MKASAKRVFTFAAQARLDANLFGDVVQQIDMGSIDADATRPRGFRQNIHRMLADLDPGVAHNGLKLYEIDALIS